MSEKSSTANAEAHDDRPAEPLSGEEAASPTTAHLFVDTNFFLQCHPPEQLDWTHWRSYDDVRLIVSKPVLREIDYRKNKGNDRAAKRARSTTARFRRMRRDGQETVRAENPCVTLSIQLQHEPSPHFEDRLDYRERDDQLIGTALGFAADKPDAQVWLLTHDTTPLLTAESLGLPSKVIPDNWLLPPEHTRAEKEVISLKAEVARLRRSEPSFLVRCADEENRRIDELATRSQCFEPLTAGQLELLMGRLRTKFPMETSFGQPKAIEGHGASFAANLSFMKRVFTPATEEEIAEYKDSTYPAWLEECEAVLTDCYKTPRQSPPPRFTFWAKNRGTRPAKDALVEIEVEGDFQIVPPVQAPKRSEDAPATGQGPSTASRTTLPRPPKPPKGRWDYADDALLGLQDTLSALTESRIGTPFQTMRDLEALSRPLPLVPPVPPVRDPNRFYYEPSRSRKPERSIRLVCAQWRHMDGPKGFAGEIRLRPDQTEVRGALLFRVQAENLSKPELQRIPVRIEVDHVSSFDRASGLVDSLSAGPHDAESGKQT